MKMPFGWRHKKTDCQWTLPLLSAYIDKRVSAEENRRLEAHIKSCPKCAEELSSLRLTTSLLRQMPTIPVPRTFTLAPMSVAQRSQPSPAFYHLRNATAAMAVVFLAVFSSIFWLPQTMSGYGSLSPASGNISQQSRAGSDDAFHTMINAPSPVPTDAPSRSSAPLSKSSADTSWINTPSSNAIPNTQATPVAVGTAPAALEAPQAASVSVAQSAPSDNPDSGQSNTTSSAAGTQTTNQETTGSTKTDQPTADAVTRAGNTEEPGPLNNGPEPAGTDQASVPAKPTVQPEAQEPISALTVIQLAVAGLLVILGLATAMVWLRDHKGWNK